MLCPVRTASTTRCASTTPDDPGVDLEVRHLVDPSRDHTLHFAESKLCLNVADLLAAAADPC